MELPNRAVAPAPDLKQGSQCEHHCHSTNQIQQGSTKVQAFHSLPQAPRRQPPDPSRSGGQNYPISAQKHEGPTVLAVLLGSEVWTVSAVTQDIRPSDESAGNTHQRECGKNDQQKHALGAMKREAASFGWRCRFRLGHGQKITFDGGRMAPLRVHSSI